MGLKIVDHQNPALNFSTELQAVELVRALHANDTIGAVRTALFVLGPFQTGDFAIYRNVGLAITSTDKLGTVRRVDVVSVPTGSPASIGSFYRQVDLVEDPANDVEWTSGESGNGAGADAEADSALVTNGDIASALGHVDYMEVRQTDA